MRRTSLFYFSLVLLSCAANESKETPTLTYEKVEIVLDTAAHSSSIRPLEKLRVGEIYSDTLIFKEYDTNYDYWYAIFNTSNSQSVSLAFDDEIPNNLEGSTFLVDWKIDTFYNAGEGDEIYFSERMVTYKVIEQKSDFIGFLADFVSAYSRVSNDLIGDYIHKETGLVSSYNPGAFCMAQNVKLPAMKKFISWDVTISDQIPEGDWCDGFEGVEEGFYFDDIGISELPKFAELEEDGEIIASSPLLQINSELEGLKKVQLISEESFRRLYFFKTEGQWYFWIEDLCDCSA